MNSKDFYEDKMSGKKKKSALKIQKQPSSTFKKIKTNVPFDLDEEDDFNDLKIITKIKNQKSKAYDDEDDE